MAASIPAGAAPLGPVVSSSPVAIDSASARVGVAVDGTFSPTYASAVDTSAAISRIAGVGVNSGRAALGAQANRVSVAVRSAPLASTRVASPTAAVTGVVSAFASQAQAGATMLSPAANFLAAVTNAFELFRRDLERIFAFRNPVAQPVQLTQTLDSQLIGTVAAYSRYGRPLSYAIAEAPTQGTVSIKDDGTWVYSPGAEVDAAGGTDQFTVTVRDASFHLFGQSGTITVPVTVYRNPQQESVELPGSAQQIVASGDGSRLFAVGYEGALGWTGLAATIGAPAVAVIDTDLDSAFYGSVIDSVVVNLGLPISSNPEETGPVTVAVSELAASADGSRLWLGSNLSNYNSGTDPDGEPVYLNRYTVTALAFEESQDSSGAPSTSQVVLGRQDFDAPITGVAVDDAAGRLYVLTSAGEGDTPGRVHIVDARTLAVAGAVEAGLGASQIAVAPSGQVVVVNTLDNTVSVIDPATSTVTATVDVIGSLPQGVAFTGNYAAVANLQSNNVSLIDLNPNSNTAFQVVQLVTTGGTPQAIAASRDGKFLYVAKFNDDAVAVIETTGYTVVTSIQTGDGPTGVAMDESGVVYTANAGDEVATTLAVTTTPQPLVTATLEQAVQAVAKDAIRIYNYTPDTWVISGYQDAPFGGTGAGAAKFPIGTSIPSNSYFQVTGLPVQQNTSTFALGYLTVTLPNATLKFLVERDKIYNQEARVGLSSNSVYSGTNLTRNELVVTTAAVQTITVDAANAGLAVDTLNKYCYKGSYASCSVQAKAFVQNYSNPEIKGAPVNNNSYKIKAETTLEESWTSGYKNTLEVGLKAETGAILSIFAKAEVNTKYAHEWNESYTFKQAIKVEIPPRTRVWLEWAEVQREYVFDYTMKLGNTTFIVKNARTTVPLGNNKAEYFINDADIPPTTPPAAQEPELSQ
ncbi:YVTN beta-propeller repeat [Mycobacteriaceae bacterium]